MLSAVTLARGVLVAMAVSGLLLGPYLIYVGARRGILEQKIQLHNTEKCLTRRRAFVRGVVYALIGAAFLGSSRFLLLGLVV